MSWKQWFGLRDEDQVEEEAGSVTVGTAVVAFVLVFTVLFGTYYAVADSRTETVQTPQQPARNSR